MSGRGFTLVEMSILLIIVGLIMGGVLIGRDLVESARIRAFITQINNYKLAAATFRNKYGGMPGDLEAGAASSFGFTDRSGAGYNHNNNGFIESCNGNDSWNNFGCEAALFWSDLSASKLITENFSQTIDDNNIEIDDGEQTLYFPSAKLDGSLYVMMVGQSEGSPWLCENFGNCYMISKVTSTAADGSYTGSFPLPGLSSMRAYIIDSKLDDGNPGTGSVVAYGGAPCYGGGVYLVTVTTVNPCALGIRP